MLRQQPTSGAANTCGLPREQTSRGSILERLGLPTSAPGRLQDRTSGSLRFFKVFSGDSLWIDSGSDNLAINVRELRGVTASVPLQRQCPTLIVIRQISLVTLPKGSRPPRPSLSSPRWGQPGPAEQLLYDPRVWATRSRGAKGMASTLPSRLVSRNGLRSSWPSPL